MLKLPPKGQNNPTRITTITTTKTTATVTTESTATKTATTTATRVIAPEVIENGTTTNIPAAHVDVEISGDELDNIFNFMSAEEERYDIKLSKKLESVKKKRTELRRSRGENNTNHKLLKTRLEQVKRSETKLRVKDVALLSKTVARG